MEEFLKEKFLRIAFKLTIGDLVDSQIMQLFPVDFARALCKTFDKNVPDPVVEKTKPQVETGQPIQQQQQMQQPQMQMQQPQMQMQQPQMQQQFMQQQTGQQIFGQDVNVQPAQFQPFSNDLLAVTRKKISTL